MPQLPMEDPSDRGSLVDRSVAYVRGNALLRVLLVATALDHLFAIVLVLTNQIRGEIAGLLGLFSVLSWFFAVCMPIMNREIRARLGGASSYWQQVAEMFFRFLLCAVTAIYTVALLSAAF